MKFLFIGLMFVACAVFGQNSLGGNCAKEIVGMWLLISWTRADGTPLWGQHPQGVIAYDASGNFSVQIMPDLPRPKYANPANPTPEEAKVALTGYTAYFGTYTVDVAESTVTHHIKGSIRPTSVDVDYIRKYEFGSDGTVTLIPVKGGGPIGSKITWRRVADRPAGSTIPTQLGFTWFPAESATVGAFTKPMPSFIYNSNSWPGSSVGRAED